MMNQDNKNLWKKRIKEQTASGMSMAAWCRQNQITKSAFYYWKKRLREDTVDTHSSFFTELKLPDSAFQPEGKAGLQLRWRDYSFLVSNSSELSLVVQFIRQVQNL